ncbi:MAG: hypothetical protein RL186_125 [Pseudomonadota bacterium]
MSLPPAESAKSSKRTDQEVLEKFATAKSRPHCSQTLSLEVIGVEQAQGRVRVAMVGKDEWCNPRGALQGGFVTAMLDEAMAVAGIVGGDMAFGVPTLELKVTFLRPCPAGPVEAEGRVVRWGKSAVFLEADLFDKDGHHVARASSTVLPIPLPTRATSGPRREG